MSIIRRVGMKRNMTYAFINLWTFQTQFHYNNDMLWLLTCEPPLCHVVYIVEPGKNEEKNTKKYNATYPYPTKYTKYKENSGTRKETWQYHRL